MLDEPDVGALQPKLLQHRDPGWFEYAGASGGYIDRFGYPFSRGRIFFTLEPDRGQYDDAREVFWATGAAICLRRQALDRVGLLDEHFFMHMEEIDLCWRLQRAGYRVMVEPSSRIFHIGGATLPQGDVRKVYYNFRNSLFLLYKNLPAPVWRTTLPLRIAIDGLALVRALIKGRLGEAGAILRAYRDAHRMKPLFTVHRPKPGERPVLPTYRGSIVVDYFLLRRRRFEELPAARFRPVPPSVVPA
jgi:GT2 family glycosyltransferase